MPLDKFVEDLVCDLLNLIVVALLDQPVQHVPLYPEVAGVDVGDVVLVVHQPRQLSQTQAAGLGLISCLVPGVKQYMISWGIEVRMNSFQARMNLF